MPVYLSRTVVHRNLGMADCDLYFRRADSKMSEVRTHRFHPRGAHVQGGRLSHHVLVQRVSSVMDDGESTRTETVETKARLAGVDRSLPGPCQTRHPVPAV